MIAQLWSTVFHNLGSVDPLGSLRVLQGVSKTLEISLWAFYMTISLQYLGIKGNVLIIMLVNLNKISRSTEVVSLFDIKGVHGIFLDCCKQSLKRCLSQPTHLPTQEWFFALKILKTRFLQGWYQLNYFHLTSFPWTILLKT